MEFRPDARGDRIETPERVKLRVDLAGIGSRGLACLIDSLLLTAGLLVWAFVGILLAPAAGAAAVAVALIGAFLVYWGYYALFEALRDGRTPGKQIMGLRVQKTGGYAIGWTEALVRNLLRALDYLPFGYGFGLVAMLITDRHQRLGDLAAGTVVVREGGGGLERLDRLGYDAHAADTAAVGLTVEEFEILHDYLVRRGELAAEAATALQGSLAELLRRRLTERAGLPAGLGVLDDEAFLLHLDAAYRGEPLGRGPLAGQPPG